MPTRSITDFTGRWQLDRRVTSYGVAPSFLADGTALFTPDGEGMRYDEELTLRIDGQNPILATRRYCWRLTGHEIALFFEDGRFFHAFDPAQDAPEAGHWCDPDQYDVRYDFSDWPRWSSRWRVRGPAKDYLMETIYRR